MALPTMVRRKSSKLPFRRAVGCCIAALALASGTRSALGDDGFVGSGSTFVAPFFSTAFAQMTLEGHWPASIRYQPNGSGAGISDLIARKVDFCATDVPMNAKEIAEAGGSIVQVPVALGGIAITYNLPQPVPGGLHLTRQAVADIFLGKVAVWNDPEIARSNPRAALPAMPITVVHRSDGSGTTYIFSDFLSSVSPEWKRAIGAAKDVRWPAAHTIAANGNKGVASAVSQTQGALGYVELTYVERSNLLTAWITNRAGDWSFPGENSIQAAASSKPTVSSTDFSIVDSPAKNAYPIAGYSWVATRRNESAADRSRSLRAMLTWLVSPAAQRIAAGMYYVPLPDNVRATATNAIAVIGT